MFRMRIFAVDVQTGARREICSLVRRRYGMLYDMYDRIIDKNVAGTYFTYTISEA